MTANDTEDDRSGVHPATIGGYTLLRALGAGATGRVFLGQDQNGAHAALKVLRTDGFERWRHDREVGALRGDFGDAVAKLFDADLEAEPPWIAMEYVPGSTLRERIDNRGELSPRSTATMGMRLANGLAALHAAKLAHRDLKPGNIMVRESTGDPVIIDFGYAIDQTAAPTADRTATRVVVGTEHWMAPEYAQGDRSDFFRVDLYGLGAILAYAATGVHPSSTSKFLSLEGVPEPLALVLRALLSHDPAKRPDAAACVKRFAALALEDQTLSHSIADMTAELSVGTKSTNTRVKRRVAPSVHNARAAAEQLRALYSKTKDLV